MKILSDLTFKITFAIMMFGRAWEHLRWDPPYRIIFWDQDIMSPIARLFGMSWDAYMFSPRVDFLIQKAIGALGLLYFIIGMVILVKHKSQKYYKTCLILSFGLLFLLFNLYRIEKDFAFAQIIEHASQLLLPIILYLKLFQKKSHKYLNSIIKIAVALTFTGHGLYAIGYYPVPGNFVDMMMNGFHLSETGARSALYSIGVIDFAVAIGIFIPVLNIGTLAWATIWAFLTTVARIYTTFVWENIGVSLSMYLPEVMVRIVHILLPLYLFLHYYQEQKQPNI